MEYNNIYARGKDDIVCSGSILVVSFLFVFAGTDDAILISSVKYSRRIHLSRPNP
jgi:hypothetical protein